MNTMYMYTYNKPHCHITTKAANTVIVSLLLQMPAQFYYCVYKLY